MPIVTAQAPLPTTAPVAPVIQPDKVETPATEEPKQDALSPKYAALARKEKAIRQQAQSIKAREDALKAKEAEYATSYVSKTDLQKRMQENPLSIMNEYGLTYDQLTQLALNQPGPDAQKIQALEAKLAALEGRQTETLSAIEKQEKAVYDQAVNQIRLDAQALIENESNNFEGIKTEGALDAVVELITENFNKTGVLLTVEQAANEIEDFIIEHATKLAGLKKVTQKLAPPVVPQKPQITEKQPLKTLTNTVSVSSRPRTEKDRIQRAILAAQGKLTE